MKKMVGSFLADLFKKNEGLLHRFI